MLWLNFSRWSHASGNYLLWDRIYVMDRWTPLVKVSWRYKGKWRGYRNEDYREDD